MSCSWIKFMQAEASLSRHVAEQTIVTRPFSNHIDRLDGSASAVWQRLAIPVTLPELVDEISATYQVEANEIASDIKALLDDLLSKHLIEEVVTSNE